ncbi:MAG: hypothetical protein H6718_20220 [Polyangiaceae bacterium]|nr:hypothetical protein [Myxococcales bacterium]MCB9587740.1 hypothetical protein [Polyangiaceae bacterium]
MTRGRSRLSLTVTRLALVALAWLWISEGAAYAASIRFIAESDTGFERRLAAEIESVGFEVEKPESPETQLPEQTAAVVYVRNDPPQVELWLLGESGKFELSSVVRDDAKTADEDADTATLRIAERLRALLQPVYVQAKAAEAAAQQAAAQGPPAPSNPPLVSVPQEPPSPPRNTAPPRAGAPEPARPRNERRFFAAMGIGLGQHASDVVPQGTLAFDYRALPSLGLGALAVLPLAKATISDGGDQAQLEAWMAGLHSYARVFPLEKVELQLGAGVLAAYVRAEGDAQSPRFGRSVDGLRWVPFLEGAAAYALTEAWLVRGAGAIGLGLPDTPIAFAGEEVAEWGKPWILTQLSLGYAW